MTHMAEAEVAIALLRDERVAGLDDLADRAESDPAVRTHLLLGAFLPDLREFSDALRFPTHDRGFAMWLLSNVASDPSLPAAHRVMALGMATHVCSDISAQVFQVPRFLSTGRVGAPDVMAGWMDDRADGEGELLVEAIVDLYYGDIQTLLDVYDHFRSDPPVPERLETALDWWLADASEFFGAAEIGDPDLIKQEIDDTLNRVAAQLTPERRRQLLAALDLADVLDLGEVLVMVEELGLLEDLVSQGISVELNHEEIRRLQDVSPFFGDPSHFEGYPDDLAVLGPQILLDSARGAPWLENWPTWRAAPMAGGALASLAAVPAVGFQPDNWEGLPGHGELGLYDLWWEDESGARVSEIATAAPIGQLTLVAQVYPLTATRAPAPARLRIRKAVPGAPYLAGPILGEGDVVLEHGAQDWMGAPPQEVRVTLDLVPTELAQAEGLHAELALAPSDPSEAATPVFTTAWEPISTALPEWGLERPVYVEQYSTYDHFPRSVRVIGLVPDETPPTAPLIAVDPIHLHPDAATLSVTIRPGEPDPESGITHYLVSLGTTEGATDLVAGSVVSADGVERLGRFEWTAPAALVGLAGELHVTAVAVNGAGLEGPAGHAEPVLLGPLPEPVGCGCHTSRTATSGAASLGFLALLLISRRRTR